MQCLVSVLVAVGVVLLLSWSCVNQCPTELEKDIPGRGVKEERPQGGEGTADCGRGQSHGPSQPLKCSGLTLRQ